ncbi:kinesin family member 2/24 [Nematocida parisii]|nr:kinesin family member 2/24 [Nematocida parisii]KAI5154220.1 kinesin family member 2/24 [Nematocida parisii]KAI5157838.1 kinesin family member 2/24 [Nematocida parisii]
MQERGTGQVPDEESVSIRKVLRENKAEEWTELLEGHGVCSVTDLRRVKYADLVQFGISEFEPRKRIFEVIKQLNTEYPYDKDRRASLHQRMQALARSSIGFTHVHPESSTYNNMNSVQDQESIPINISSKDGVSRDTSYVKYSGGVQDTSKDDSFTYYTCNNTGRDSLGIIDTQSTPTESVHRRDSIMREGYAMRSTWKRKKDLVNEIMKEAEDSIILEGDSIQDSSTAGSTSEYSCISDVHTESVELSGCKDPLEDNRITVIVRKRPIKPNGKRDTVSISGAQVILTESKQKVDLTPYMEPHTYTFDRAYGECNTTMDIYRECVKQMVNYSMAGGSSTCIAYGQTGSGKTYTMLNEHTGMIVLALKDLLREGVRVSFYEIYSNSIYDLLEDRKKIFAREKDGVVSIMGVKEVYVGSVTDAISLIKQGLQCRMTGKTGANNNSSRSHALVRVRTARGIFTFVDLAGSERGTERGMESQQSLIKREGAEINKSLLALKECIRAMDKSAVHLPFRHSKLTQVLKESLVGESKCCIIATISPEEASTEHSLNTLRYAHRIRGLGSKKREDSAGTSLQSTGSIHRQHKQALCTNTPSAYTVHVKGAPVPGTVLNAVQSTPVRERVDREKVSVSKQGSPVAQRVLVQQALASVASRVARESDPETLEVLKEALLDIAKYQKIS